MKQKTRFHKTTLLFSFICYTFVGAKPPGLGDGLTKTQKINEKSDEELLRQYGATGDAEYFGLLYNRYMPLLYGVGLKYLQDADKAQDAVMQLFEDLLPKLNSYKIEVFRTWIYTVMKNHCLQMLRKENKEIVVDFRSELMESDEVLHLLDEPDKDDEKHEALKHCMDKLPDKQRISIRHFFLEEMSYADVVDATGFSLKQVKSYIQNGKRNLKICIERNSP